MKNGKREKRMMPLPACPFVDVGICVRQMEWGEKKINFYFWEFGEFCLCGEFPVW